MGNIGDPIVSGSIPAVGSVGTAYATNIDLFLTEVKTRLEAKVPLASLQVGTFDLSNNPLNNAEWVGLFAQLSAPTSPVGTVQNFGNDLWWVSAAGAVQITSGNLINAANIGSITGDYGGANPAQFRYTASTSTYTAYSNFSTGTYGRVWAENFDIASTATGVLRVRLDTTGLVSSYTLNLPTALPVDTRPVLLSSTGQLSTNANGQIYLGRRIFTSGTSATYTPTAGTRFINLKMVGGGGGGGGALQVTTGSAGGGGAGGQWIEQYLNPGASATYTIGAAGGGGAAGANNGTAGGNTTFVIGGLALQANGGLGGGSSATIAFGGTPSAASNPGVDFTGQQGGDPGVVLKASASIAYSGSGGSTPFGGGGQGQSLATGPGNNLPGNNALGYGAGGGGALCTNTGTSQAGGNGTAGVIIIDEYM